jgi:hypothetical protein
MIDVGLSEVTRQVHVSCSERGILVDALRSRLRIILTHISSKKAHEEKRDVATIRREVDADLRILRQNATLFDDLKQCRTALA